jgi:hypothetical protein
MEKTYPAGTLPKMLWQEGTLARAFESLLCVPVTPETSRTYIRMFVSLFNHKEETSLRKIQPTARQIL